MNKDTSILEIAKSIYKKTLGYQLAKTVVCKYGVQLIHSDEFLDEHPERRENPKFTEEEEKESIEFLAKMAKTCGKLDNIIDKQK